MRNYTQTADSLLEQYPTKTEPLSKQEEKRIYDMALKKIEKAGSYTPPKLKKHRRVPVCVAAAVAALDEAGIKYQLSGMGTLLEAENPNELFDAIKIAHEAVFKAGSQRVVTSVKIDDRRDRDRTMADKVHSVEKKLR